MVRELGYQSKDKRCIVSGVRGVDLHHVKTRGSGGTDDAWNLMPLSRKYHTEVHQLGLTTFASRYPAVAAWLRANDWVLDEARGRWVHV